MYRVACVLVLALWASVGYAADKPEFGPPPAWVKPIAIPAPDKGQDDTIPVRLLTTDLQVNYDANGDDVYEEIAARLQTPAGLAAASIALPWQPDTQTLTIHFVHIIRDGQTIDVLANGQTFDVLRRETNLERAMLTGVLTASLQPEGLQVGDTLDYAYSIRNHDPVMQGYAEFIAAIPPGGLIDHLRIRELWPTSQPMQWRELPGLPAAKVVKTAAGTELRIEGTNIKRPTPPDGSPPRYSYASTVIVSQFANWSAVSAIMAPLYAKASTLPDESPLKAEVARIRAVSADPKVQAAAALHLVQEKVRYLFLGMNEGGYVPADADTTWSRRFGDCKGKTALLLALLRELGIDAEPAMVSTVVGDGLDQQPPALELFDHILVRARIDGRAYWLDGTRTGDRDLDSILVPPFHWALPVQPKDAALERLVVAPLDAPELETHLRVDASGGLDARAPVHLDTILRGDSATQMRLALANASHAEAEKALRASYARNLSWIDADDIKFNYDDSTGEERVSLEGTGLLGWYSNTDSGTREYTSVTGALSGNPDYKRDPDQDQNAPFAVVYPSFTKSVETVVLPQNGAGFSLVGSDVDQTIAGVAYKRTAHIDGGVFNLQLDIKSIAPEFPASEAAAADVAFREVSNNPVIVRAPKTYAPSAQEYQFRLAGTPVSADEYVDRGDARIWAGDYPKAMADYAKAVQLKPDSAWMLNARCFARAEAGKDLDLALADCNASLALDPHVAATLDSRGFVYFRMGQLDKALIDDNAALTITPKLAPTLYVRGIIERRKGDATAGDADVAAAKAIDPNVAANYAHYGIDH